MLSCIFQFIISRDTKVKTECWTNGFSQLRSTFLSPGCTTAAAAGHWAEQALTSGERSLLVSSLSPKSSNTLYFQSEPACVSWPPGQRCKGINLTTVLESTKLKTHDCTQLIQFSTVGILNSYWIHLGFINWIAVWSPPTWLCTSKSWTVRQTFVYGLPAIPRPSVRI